MPRLYLADLGFSHGGGHVSGRRRLHPEGHTRETRPALVIWGEADAYLPLEFAERQRETFPGAEVVTIPGAGHWPFVDDPTAVRERLLGFLRTQMTVPVA